MKKFLRSQNAFCSLTKSANPTHCFWHKAFFRVLSKSWKRFNISEKSWVKGTMFFSANQSWLTTTANMDSVAGSYRSLLSVKSSRGKVNYDSDTRDNGQAFNSPHRQHTCEHSVPLHRSMLLHFLRLQYSTMLPLRVIDIAAIGSCIAMRSFMGFSPHSIIMSRLLPSLTLSSGRLC